MEEIKTEKEYRKALERLKEIFDAEPDTSEGHELDRLADLVKKYEDVHYPMG